MSTNRSNYDPLAGFGPRVLSHVQLRLIFWGSEWDKDEQKTLRARIKTSVNAILESNYLEGLAQYNRGVHIKIKAEKADRDVDPRYDPPRRFADPADPRNPAQASDVIDEIKRLLEGHQIDHPEDTSTDLLCLVVMPPGVTCSSNTEDGEPPVGQHFYFDCDCCNRRVYYGWVLNASAEKITTLLSEELVEAITDPEPPTGWVMKDNIGVNRELCDVCEAITGKVKGVLVKAYYSLEHGDAIQFKNGGEPAPGSKGGGANAD